MAAVIIQLAVTPVTLGVAAAFAVIGILSRWRPSWLLLPAVTGLGWTAAIGVGRAVAGYLGMGGQLVRVLVDPAAVSVHLTRLAVLAASWRHGIGGQLPVALIIAAAQARIAVRLAAVKPFRPGMIVAVRRAYVRAVLRRGEAATLDGCCVGIIPHLGKRIAISWEEARGGVLITGHDAAPVTGTGLELAIAAIQHRKTVIVVDLAGGGAADPGCGQELAAAVLAACAGARAPMAVLDADRGHYDPFSRVDSGRAAGLVSAMIDWTGIGREAQMACEDVLRTAFSSIAARPRGADSPAAVIDDVAGLLRPGGLLAAPAVAAALAARLGELRSTALGARLSRPKGAGEAIDLALAMADRQAALFCLDRYAHGWPAEMLARLVLADLVTVLADRAGLRAPGDCLVWISGCQAGDLEQVAALLAVGPGAGAAIVCTAAGEAADRLASLVNVVAVHGQPPRASAAHARSPAIADTPAGESLFSQDDSQRPPAMPVRVQRPDDLTVRVRSPRPRVVTGCRAAR